MSLLHLLFSWASCRLPALSTSFISLCCFPLRSHFITCLPPTFLTFFLKVQFSRTWVQRLDSLLSFIKCTLFFSLLSNDASFCLFHSLMLSARGSLHCDPALSGTSDISLTSFLSPGNKTLDILHSGIYPNGLRHSQCLHAHHVLYSFVFLLISSPLAKAHLLRYITNPMLTMSNNSSLFRLFSA